MLSSHDCKHFLRGDALYDYLDTYHPLPPLPKPILPLFPSSRESTIQAFQNQLDLNNICYASDKPIGMYPVTFHVELRDEQYIETLPCVVDVFRCPLLSNLVKTQWAILWFDVTSKLSEDSSYMQVKMHMMKQLLPSSTHINVTSIDKQKVSFSKIMTWSASYCNSLVKEVKAWLQLLHDKGSTWSLDTPNVYMYPNVSLREVDQYTHIRESMAWKVKDVSLLYYVGKQTRRKLHEKGVFRLDDPSFETIIQDVSYNVTPTILQIQQKMRERMFLPVTPLEIVWCDDDPFRSFVYFDIETSFGTDGASLVNMVGCLLWENDAWTYKSFVSKDNECVVESATWLREHCKGRTIVHYTQADCLAIPSEWSDTLDLYQTVSQTYITDDNLQALHIYNLKLKTIYKQLTTRCGCPNLYDACEVKHGLDALRNLTEWRVFGHAHLLEQVQTYNRVDVIALFLLHMYIKQTFPIDAKDLLNTI